MNNLNRKFIQVGVPAFYKLLASRFENARKLAYKMMVISTYHCKQLFSVMTASKSLAHQF